MNDYDKSSQDFISQQPIGYLQELYDSQSLVTVIEDGKPTKWCWED